MSTEPRPPARDKYREAAFFRQRLERADDGHVRNVRSQTDKDEFRFYCSAFASAVDEIHSQVEQADDDHPAFEEWVADEPLRDLHRFFRTRADDVFEVHPTRGQDVEEAGSAGGTTTLTVGSTAGTYGLQGQAVPDTLAMEYGDGRDEAGLAIADLAETYLDRVDAWLADRELEAEPVEAGNED